MSTLDASEFYHKLGYIGIHTPDHPDDEDYPGSYLFGSCVGWWFAKPINENASLDGEDIYHIPGDHGGKPTRWVRPMYFRDPVPTELEMQMFFEPESTEACSYAGGDEVEYWRFWKSMADRLNDPEERARMMSNWCSILKNDET